MISALLALCPAVLLSPTAPSADSWGPFQERVEVSEGGEFAVLLQSTKRGQELRYELVGRAPKQAPLKAVSIKDAPKNVVPLGSGTLSHLPVRVLVSSTGLGFASLERYYRVGYGQSITTVGGNGLVMTTRTLPELFSEEEREGLAHSVSSYHWMEDSWIDEEAGEVIVIGGGKIFAASFRRDQLRIGGEEEIIRGLAHGGRRGAQAALERLAGRRIERLLPTYEKLFGESQPLAIRLRAGLALARLGDLRATALFKEIATSKSSAVQAKRADLIFVLENLKALCGIEALPILRESMRGPAGRAWSASMRGFESFGEEAIPTLNAMLREISESNDYRGGAAHTMAKIGSPLALEALFETVGDKEDYVAGAAVKAAIAIDEEGAGAGFLRWLTAETDQMLGVLYYFEEHKYPEALPALRTAYEKATDAEDREWIAKVIAFQMK